MVGMGGMFRLEDGVWVLVWCWGVGVWYGRVGAGYGGVGVVERYCSFVVVESWVIVLQSCKLFL